MLNFEIAPYYSDFKLNKDGYLNKTGENVIFCRQVELIKFGIGSIHNGNMFLSGGFLSLFPGNGFGRFSIIFLFERLPCITSISLQCKDNVLSFWLKCGGVINGRIDEYNIVYIYRK